MRRAATAVPLLTAATLVTGLLVAAAVPASAAPTTAPTTAAPAAGTYVPLSAPVRVLDTRTGANGNPEGAVGAGRVIAPKVVGIATVPATGVGSVAITLSAVAPTGSGGLLAFGDTEPATSTNLQFATGDRGVSDTAVVPVTSTGTIGIRNQASSGSVQIVADVTGYYAAGTPSDTDPGVYHPLSSNRILDTRRDGARKPLAAGKGITLDIGGKVGVPAEANAVAATVTVVGPTRTGSIAAWRDGDAATTMGAVHFAAGQRASGFTVLGLGGGKVNLRNTSTGTVHVVVDVTGFYVGNVSQSAGTLRPVQGARVLSSSVAASADRSVVVGGLGGVPLANVSAVLVTVHAVSPKAAGSLQAWRSGTTRPSTTVAFYFDQGVTTSNTILVPVTHGRIALHNTARGSTGLVVDVHGYVPSDTITPPATYVGRYPNQLTGSSTSDRARMRADGAADGAAGSRFVLLDIGAQSVTAPTLSRTKPGVVLALRSPRTALTYGTLVAYVTEYLKAYAAAAPGTTATIAVGTNNDGAFDARKKTTYYAPATRGRDWADRVIDPLRAAAPEGLSVVGADDIEAYFASTQYQALDWESAYLKYTKAPLVYNGSLDGCASTFGSTAACAYGWTQAQYVKLASNQGRVTALPQIYTRNQSVQWANLDKASKGKLRYSGVLTESLDADKFSASQGWVAFVRALASVRTTVPGLRSVDIQPDTGRN